MSPTLMPMRHGVLMPRLGFVALQSWLSWVNDTSIGLRGALSDALSTTTLRSGSC